jgi:hypothetical protein
MPTNRRRSLRRMTVSNDAQTWLESDDARRFFAEPETYLEAHQGVNPYATPAQRLPSVRPWWGFLWEVLADMRAGVEPAELDHKAAGFVRDLEAAYNERRSK